MLGGCAAGTSQFLARILLANGERVGEIPRSQSRSFERAQKQREGWRPHSSRGPNPASSN